jgi:hypothetical protein
MSIEFIGIVNGLYHFMNEKYYFILDKKLIRKRYYGNQFMVKQIKGNSINNINDWESIRTSMVISGKEINEQIKIIRKEFPELLL